MKIRTDFVTNSSSVSYILTMNLEMVDNFLSYWRNTESQKENLQIANALKSFMQENGVRTYLHEHELYTYLLEFSDDDDMTCVTKNFLLENGETADPSEMDAEDLLRYINGEYVHRGRLNELVGFGATLVEHY